MLFALACVVSRRVSRADEWDQLTKMVAVVAQPISSAVKHFHVRDIVLMVEIVEEHIQRETAALEGQRHGVVMLTVGKVVL
jgi:hypothetical protein